MKTNRRASYFMSVAAAALLLVPLAASADDDNKGFKVSPFHFGQGALATWEQDAGEPGQKGDPKQHGLYLQKHTATPNFSAAGAALTKLKPMPAADLSMLAFDIPGFAGEPTFNVANGYCGAGAPRFNVSSTDFPSPAPPCFLGCAHGDKTQDPVTGWWEIKFVAPFTQYPGCTGAGGESAIGGTVTSISILFDEGNDVALPAPNVGLSPGDVVLDNIRVNSRVVGKPTGDGD